MGEICQKVLDGLGMPAELALSIVVTIFMGKSDTRNCSCYRAVKLLEHGMKVVERVLEKRLYRIGLLIKCNLALCLREEQLMLYLSCDGCKKNIMLKEKSCRCALWT